MELLECCWRIGLALLLGALIGLERNKRVKEAGIRTHGLVCVGACVFMLLSQFAIPRIDGVTFRCCSYRVNHRYGRCLPWCWDNVF